MDYLKKLVRNPRGPQVPRTSPWTWARLPTPRCRWSHWRDTPREEVAAIINGDTNVEEALASPIGDTDVEESAMQCYAC